MTVEELEKQLKTFQSDFEATKKSFELKLDAAKKDADSWKSVAEAKDAEAKKFQAAAEAAEKEKQKALSESRAKDFRSFLENAKKEGRITPAVQEIAQRLGESMTSESVVATFEKKDGSKVQHTQLSLFMELIGALQKTSVFRSLTKDNSHVEGPASEKGEVVYSEAIINGERQRVILDDTDLDERTKLVMAEAAKVGRVLTYGDAMIEAEKLIRAEAQGA